MYGIKLTSACRCRRDDLLQDLLALGIACRRGNAPINLEPMYVSRCGALALPITEDVAARSIFLPMFASLSDADQDRVIQAVTSALARVHPGAGAPPPGSSSRA